MYVLRYTHKEGKKRVNYYYQMDERSPTGWSFTTDASKAYNAGDNERVALATLRMLEKEYMALSEYYRIRIAREWPNPQPIERFDPR